MTDLDPHLVELLDLAVPQPPRELDGPSLRAGQQRNPWLVPALAAAALVAVLAAVIAFVRLSGTRNHGAAPQQVVPAGSSPYARTVRAVERLLSVAPVLPGADEVAAAPAAILREPMSVYGNVRRTRWWTAPGSVPQAMTYLAAHAPPGTKPTGDGSAGDSDGVFERSIEFDASGARWAQRSTYTGLELQIDVVSIGTRVGLRADVQATWLPRRTASELIRTNLDGVRVVVNRPGTAASVRRTLDAAAARSLASLVNRLPVQDLGIRHCPMSRSLTDKLVFFGGDSPVRLPDVHVDVYVDGCGMVSVQGLLPRLGDGSALDQAVLSALDLPSNYGR